jgi:membrane-associated phospholipid phosphatase
MKKMLALVVVFQFSAYSIFSQSVSNNSIATDSLKTHSFNYKQLIVPAVLIGYGVVGLHSDQLKGINLQIREEVTEDIDRKISIDDFSQWAPAASVFALSAFGDDGKNDLRNRTVLFITSYAIMSATVLSLKSLTHVERPDGTSKNSFPSGHTATAFAGAEFMWQEYKDKSIWYGIAGYAVATGTGAFRIYNNRHWLTDVAAGAGIGILSTKIAYWINPYVKCKLFGNAEPKKSISFLMPSFDGKTVGLSFIKTF